MILPPWFCNKWDEMGTSMREAGAGSEPCRLAGRRTIKAADLDKPVIGSVVFLCNDVRWRERKESHDPLLLHPANAAVIPCQGNAKRFR